MSNCIQITIGNKKYQFRDVDLQKSSSLNDVLAAITADPNYASQLDTLNTELNQTNLDEIESTKDIPEDVTDRNTYIADNLMGNVNPYTFVQIYKRTGVPNSEFLTAFKNIMDRGKSNKLGFLISNSPTQVYLGNNRDLIVLNKNDMYNMPKVLGAMSYVHAHNSLLDNQSAIYKMAEQVYDSIMQEPTSLREELSKIPDKYSALRRLLYYTQSNRYIDNLNIASFKKQIGDHLFGETVRSIRNNKNKDYFRLLNLNPIQFKALEDLVIQQEIPVSINFGNSSVQVNDLNKFRLDYIEAEKKDNSDVADITDDMLATRLSSLNPTGAFDTSLFPTNKGQRLLLMTNPIGAFVYDISNMGKVSKYVTKFTNELQGDENIQEKVNQKLLNTYTSYGRGTLDANALILDLIQEASTNRLDFTKAEDLAGFDTLFVPNVQVQMDESLTSAPNRLLRFNHTTSLSVFEKGHKIVFNPKEKYVRIVGGKNSRIEINPDFNMNVSEDYDEKVKAVMKVADTINNNKSTNRAIVMKYDENYDTSIEEGVANLNRASSAFSAFLHAMSDYLLPEKQFLYMNSDGKGQFAQAMVTIADHNLLTPVVFDQMSKWVYDRAKSDSKAEWIKTFSGLMNSTPFTDNAVHHFYEKNSFIDRAFSSVRSGSDGKVWENLNPKLTEIEEARGEISQFEMLGEGLITMIPTNAQKYNYALRNKNVGDVFTIRDENDPSKRLRVELQDKVILTHRYMGGRNLDSNKELIPGDIIRLTPTSNYQVTIIEVRPDGYLGAYLDGTQKNGAAGVKLFHKEDLEQVVRTQYTAQVRELEEGVRGVYTNLGMFIKQGESVAFIPITSTDVVPLVQEFFSKEIQDISDKSGFSTDFIRRNYLGTPKKLGDAIFLDLSLSNGDIDSDTNIDEVVNSDNLSTSEYVDDLVSSLSSNGVRVRSLTMEEMKQQFPTLNNVKAFVYDGEVILNKDLMTDDTLIHEISHLFLADLKAKSPDTYFSLVEGMEGSEAYNDINDNGAYDELTHSDKLEEALVHEFSDYFTRVLKDYRGRNLRLDEVDWNTIFTSVLQTDVSEFYDESLYSLMKTTLETFHSNYANQRSLFDKENALRTIRLSNIKSELLKNASADSGYRLIEICE